MRKLSVVFLVAARSDPVRRRYGVRRAAKCVLRGRGSESAAGLQLRRLCKRRDALRRQRGHALRGKRTLESRSLAVRHSLFRRPEALTGTAGVAGSE